MHKKNKKLDWLSKKEQTLILLLLVSGCLIFMIAYSAITQFNSLSKANWLVNDFFSSHRQTFLNNFFRFITSLGDPIFFVMIISLTAISWVYRRRETWRPLLMLSSIGIATLASSLIKQITGYPRPDDSFMVPPLEVGFSFPSTHTTLMLVFLLVTGYLFYSRYRKRNKKLWLYNWLIITVIGTVMMALSRLYLGYHWLTDIIASIGLSLVIFTLIIVIDKYSNRKI